LPEQLVTLSAEANNQNKNTALLIGIDTGKEQCLFIFTHVSNKINHNVLASHSIILFLQQVFHAFLQLNKLHEQTHQSVLLLDKFSQLSTLFKELASEWFWRTEPDMTFTSVNNLEREDNTYAKTFINKTIESLRTKNEQRNTLKWQAFAALIAEHEDFNGFEFEVKASTPLWVSLNGKSQFDENGNFIGYLGIAKDITVSKERETALENEKLKAEEASKTKTKFLTIMSHEIRTPMNAIMGMIELLIDTDLTQEQRQWLNYANSSADILYGLITDVLDFSKIESGTVLIANKPLNVKLLIENIVGQLHIIEDSEDIIFSVSINDNIPTFIMGDEFRLGQILFNLIGNAFKFTRSGHIALCVNIVDDNLKFTIEDSGVGIAKKDLSFIFQPFRQVNEGINRKNEGVGLGLSISKNLIELMDGSISVETQLGLGSTFTILLPFKEAIIDEIKPDLSSKQPVLSVLVAEDNKTNQVLIKAFLQKLNHKVTIANDGVEAIEFMKLKHFDLILMDIMMPTMDGLSATQHIRHELLSDIPIFALTANASTDDKASCFKVGVNKVLTKPIKFETLKASLSTLL
jgi:signal transduction histidine kinase/CheY-like chemotaxis protein